MIRTCQAAMERRTAAMTVPDPGREMTRSFARNDRWTYRPSFFDGAVGLCPVPSEHREAEQGHGDMTDPGLDEASALLQRAYPLLHDEFMRTIAVVHPITHARVPSSSLCSNSANSTLSPPGILLTVTRPSATAEAFVHEMAHHKLFAAGVTTDHGGGILHETDKLAYSAAVERDRPIPAIMHAAYSFLHMVAFDLAMIEAGLCGDESRQLLSGNLRVSRDTLQQLQRHAVPTAAGRVFLSELADWGNRLFARADAV